MLRGLAMVTALTLASGCSVLNGLGGSDDTSDASVDANSSDAALRCTDRLCYREVRLDLLGEASDIALGDFSGSPGFVVSTWQGWITVFRGNGDGTFQMESPQRVPSQVAAGVAAGDFDNDSLTDVATFEHHSDGGTGQESTFTIYYGAGTDTEFTVTGSGERLISGYFSADDRVDLAMATTQNELVVMIADGLGVWSQAARQPVPGSGRDLTAGFFDADGLDDIAVAHWDAGGVEEDGVTIFYQNSTGAEFSDTTTIPTTPPPRAIDASTLVSAAPVEDVVVAKSCPECSTPYDLVRVYPPAGSPGGGFQWEGLGMNVIEIIQEDFDGDGRPDVAMLTDVADNVTAPELLVLFADSNNLWSETQWISLGATENARFVSADFNGDDIMDFAVAKSGNQEILLLLSDETLR